MRESLDVAGELKIDDAVVKTEQLVRRDFGWYWISSTATFYDADLAKHQAQVVWDTSAVQRVHRESKVSRARYGFEEVETGYYTCLGSLDNIERPWETPESRAEYMKG